MIIIQSRQVKYMCDVGRWIIIYHRGIWPDLQWLPPINVDPTQVI